MARGSGDVRRIQIIRSSDIVIAEYPSLVYTKTVDSVEGVR